MDDIGMGEALTFIGLATVFLLILLGGLLYSMWSDRHS